MVSDGKYGGFLGAVEQLCHNDETCRKACSKFIKRNDLSTSDIEILLNTLASLLLNQQQTLVVAHHLLDALPKILAIALSENVCEKLSVKHIGGKLLHEKRCVALGKLLSIHPDVITFAMHYFKDNPSPFHDWDQSDEPISKKRKMSLSLSVKPVSEEDIALCCFNILKTKLDHFREMWNWSIFFKKFLNHDELYVRWLACQCCALVLKMSNQEKETLLGLKLKPEEIINCSVKFAAEEIMKEKKFATLGAEFSCSDIDHLLPCIQKEAVTSIAGITLPRILKAASTVQSTLVMVNSTHSNLHAIALGVATGKSLCLQGPVGCGKTALVEHLAKMTGRANPPGFLSVQLGDQTDSKMLLGTYQCTDIPGEFVWKPGVLTQAVVGGHWLLLEDIDSCTTDVAAVLTSLLENKSLSVPGYKDCVHAAPGFQLFLTQRLITGVTGLHKLNTGVTSMLQRHWLTVQMEPLSQLELVEVVQTLYPSLSTVAHRMVDVFLLFSAGSHHLALGTAEKSSVMQSATVRVQTAGARLPSTRDLMKWCNRSSEGFLVSSPESGLKLFQDAIDIFCCNVSNSAMRLELAKSIAAKLGIIHTKADYYCNLHKPVISCTSSYITTGRVTLPRMQTDAVRLNVSSQLKFSFTRPAAALLERIACCISQNEPVLLVGETGVGKTSSIQYLAQQIGQSLSVINMNQQSDSSDLLGGYKPVELTLVISPLRDEFETLFRKFFSVDDNAKYLSHIAGCFTKKKWSTLLALMKHSTSAALKRFDKNEASTKSLKEDSSSKNLYTKSYKKDWLQLSAKLHRVDEQLKKCQNALAFKFVEGSLVRALQEGRWVLLDEINLASAQTLECLSSLLEGSTGSLYLLERGDDQSVKRHPDFRIFAAMNPATDVGKKELPPGIRNRFTEFFVDELVDRQDLLLLCGSYLAPLALPASKLDALVRFYLTICQEALSSLSDGTGHKPHYSLRTLCRALSVAAANPCCSVPRSLYEGFLLSFLTQLDRVSHPVVEDMIAKAVLVKASSDPKSLTKQPIPAPVVEGKTFVEIQGYWITQGPLEPIVPDKYIMTKTVKQNLRDLVRVVSLARLPVLLQGETSVGKTSLITYLAQLSGNRCLRINNHEHTDLQEYIGCYAADEVGNLVFKEGVLVEAMRYGHWVILDELNLAPSDVLEALNRVLDDNRELFIAETQKVVKAHPNFMLFATQNPPGLYGGRKVLSRAFRNRFIELHFDEIPPIELETIMHLRCDMPPSYCKKMVAVMSDLQVRRRGSAAFAGKQGFITLRDLFRWGERYRLAQNHVQPGKFYDWDQHIADEGYLILAGRVRKEEECEIIRESLSKHIKRKVNPDQLFTLNAETSSVTRAILESISQNTPPEFRHIVWTYNIRRLAVLLGKACQFNEPVLLIGETGCGKTTLCQLLAASRGKDLITVNCHMHSESSDFLGGLRPVREHSEETRGKLFEWVDGPLITAMQEGGIFLADEISLADDSVLERLNSLLEPERKLLLAEKGSDLSGEPCEVAAEDGFIFVGTMNPGGDYGKKELSPALRNRFTEIWCEGCSQRSDLIAVIEHNLQPGLVFKSAEGNISSVGSALFDFMEWFSETELGNRFARSLRDVMTWVNFINVCTGPTVSLDLGSAYIHGACLTFLDSLGTGLTSFATREAVLSVRIAALEFLRGQVMKADVEPGSIQSFLSSDLDKVDIVSTPEKFGIRPFYVSRGSGSVVEDPDFLLSAPTTRINAMRVLRGLQLGKALLLEGSPGVGKTSLVAALARATGHKLTRINLSDQTDISDLFGADLPVEDGEGGQFQWRDGPFLQALKAGHWILLDELNLASQSVLEGLNAVLDHRGDLYIPELGRTFHIQSGRTRLFACQNPLNQGGARKGLPQSFLNRFTQVFMDTLTVGDLEFICQTLYPALPSQIIQSMVNFNQYVSSETAPGGKWGQRGAPWEMNLRDLSRWCEITLQGTSNGILNPGRFVQLIYVDRMRSLKDKEIMMDLYNRTFSAEYPYCSDIPQLYVTPSTLYLGDVTISRGNFGDVQMSKLVLRHQLGVLQSLARCVSMGWLSILVGPSGSGKTSLVHLLAQLGGKELRTLVVNSAMDTTEILGGFEQADFKRHLDEIALNIEKIMLICAQKCIILEQEQESNCLLSLWETYMHLNYESCADGLKTMDFEVRLFSQKIEALEAVLSSLSKISVPLEEHIEELQCLQEKLIKLKGSCKAHSSLNAGGRFEWVDSILIKSLEEGCWLLVDNVNLCSAAVLDRLNGLLEPQGVLTVSERGVDSHGELVTVRPHPNFRLFLAMDPKYGEISRAMRNRGVEIYVASSEGDVTSSLCPLDQTALLHNIGVKSLHDIHIILSIHQTMSNLIQGPDPPGLTELLHASFLFVQQMDRGMCSVSALLSSFTKVYIQSRVCDSIDVKRRNLCVLEETIQKEAIAETRNAVDKIVSQSTLKAGDVFFDSHLAMVKQRSAILSAFVDFQEEDVQELCTFLGIPAMKVNIQHTLTNLVLMYYQTCSIVDVSLGFKWLERAIQGSAHEQMVGRLSELLHKTLLSAEDLAESTLVWDRRWLPDVSAAIAVCCGVNDCGLENRVALLLYITAQSVSNENLYDLDGRKKHRQISILEYSNAVSKGTLADSSSSEPIFIEISPFLDFALGILKNALSTVGILVSNDLYLPIRGAFLWIQRFVKLASSLYLSQDKNLESESRNLLAAHFRWFSKHAIPLLIQLANEALFDVSPFCDIVERINQSVISNNSKLWPVGKKLRREIGEPLPIASEHQAQLISQSSRLCSIIYPWHSDTNHQSAAELANFLTTCEGKKMKESLTIACRDIFVSAKFDQVELRLQQAEELHSKSNLFVERKSCIDGPVSHAEQRKVETFLWPFEEAFCLHAASAIMLNILQGQSLSLFSHDLSTFIQAMRKVPSISASLIGFFEAVLLERTDIDLFQGFALMCHFSCRSLAITNFQNWVSCNLESLNDTNNAEEHLALHNPLLSRLAANLLFYHTPSSKDQLVISSLENHIDHSKLLVSLRLLFWHNAEILSNPQYSYRLNEMKSAVAAAKYFLSCLGKSSGLPNSESLSLQHQASSIIENMQNGLDRRSSSSPEFYSMLSELVNILVSIESRSTVTNEMLMQVGLIWSLLGCLESQLFSAFPQIDPMSKYAIKLKHTEEEIQAIQSELLAAKMFAAVRGTRDNSLPSHPLLLILQKHSSDLEEQLSSLNRRVAVRPDPPMYFVLTKEMQHYSNSLCSTSVISNLSRRLMSITKKASLSEAQTILKEAQTWLHSQESFRSMLEKRFSLWYPDVVCPLLASSAKLSRGIQLMVGIGKKVCQYGLKGPLCSTLSSLICSSGNFPSLSSKQPSILALVSNLTDKDISTTIEQALHTLTGKETSALKEQSQLESYSLLKSASMELKNFICLSQNCKSQEWQAFIQVLRIIVGIWQRQEEERKDRELENESLYKSRGAIRCQTVSEDVEVENEIKELFPSMKENDFGDLEQQKNLEGPTINDPKDNCPSSPLSVILTDEDVYLFSSLHVSLALSYTKAAWIDNSTINIATISPDFLTPWLQRCGVSARLLSLSSHVLDDFVDESLLPSWILASYLASADSELLGEALPDASFDFYRSSCVSQVKQCKPVLDGLLEQVNQYLCEWPEHPTLNQIVVVINRIKSFPISSPVARFLTGLEILLNKVKEWEENAHRGVSLSLQLQAITKLIFEWRQLELKSWRGCLNAAALRVQIKASRWWFYIFSLVDTQLCGKFPEGEATSTKDFVSTLERFMEEAPLGEYDARLNMILAFHCHLVNAPASPRQRELKHILWNLHGFYSQFKDVVSNKIIELKAPIEKKLKDYVKIARWNDINYWAVKDTVFKIQRTLHKHVREFEVILRQSAKSVMTSSSILGKAHLGKGFSQLQPHIYVVKDDHKSLFGNVSELDLMEDDASHVYRAGTLFTKSKKLMKDIVLHSTAPSLVSALDNFAGDIAATVQHLSSLEVDRTIPKSKQISQAKNQLQMKRKALADLFRKLHHIGLSYHTGLTLEEDHVKFEFTQLPPLDILRNIKSVNDVTQSSLSSADKETVSAWDGCRPYLLRSWARHVQLTSALRNPHKDHGPPNVERLKGFPIHLLSLIQDYHKEVYKNTEAFSKIRIYLFQITSLQDHLTESLPSVLQSQDWNTRLQSLLSSASVTLHQFRLLLNACPENIETTEDSIPVLINNIGSNLTIMQRGYKNDISWQAAVEIVDQILKLADESLQYVKTIQSHLVFSTAEFFTGSHFKMFSKCYSNVAAMAEKLEKLQKLFVMDSCHPCINSLHWLCKYMQDECSKFSESSQAHSITSVKLAQTSPSLSAISDKVNDLMGKVLMSIQKIYKTYVSFNEVVQDDAQSKVDVSVEEKQEEGNKEDNDEDLEEKHLTNGILKSLQSDLEHLSVSEISESLQLLIKDLLSIICSESQSDVTQKCIRLALRSVPLLQQWLLLYQFLLQQQVGGLRASCKLLSILLAVFLDVTVKGFCTPEDLVSGEEAGDGEGQSDSKQEGAMGLGDGEGEKDVSDRIESEDQLEDARPAGEERKDEDKDCKEEDKGIEMSENFDGKLQDVNPEEDKDEDDDKENEDDAEKEMGDTEKDADCLDEQIWGSDSENNDSGDEGDGNDEEKGNSGEKLGEKEFGARENEAKSDGKTDDDSTENSEEKTDENNRPEINEMKEPEIDDNQCDPYHGNQQPDVEPDPLDLPEDLQLDDGDPKENEDGSEDNPFDVDEMKEQVPPEVQQEQTQEDDQNKADKTELNGDSSDDEDPQDAKPDDGENHDNPTSEDEGHENSDERKDGKKQDDAEEECDPAKEEEESKTDQEERKPSKDDPTTEPTQTSEEDVHKGSMDQVASVPQETPETSGEQPPEEAEGDPGGDEKDAVGQAPANQELQGHHSDQSGKRPKRDNQNRQDQEEKRQRPGQSDSQRSLGDINEPVKKRLKTVHSKETDNEDGLNPEEEELDIQNSADLYQHIRNEKEKSKMQTLDAATDEQAAQQPVLNNDEEEVAPPDQDEPMEMDPETTMEDVESNKKLKEEAATKNNKEKTNNDRGKQTVPNVEEDSDKTIEIEGEKVDTLGASRGPDTTFHTRYEELVLPSVVNISEIQEQNDAVRKDLQNQLSMWNQESAGEESNKAWQSLTSLTNSLARDLSEQLRLVLEPTQATRMKGNFRTGRRINMRKVIPYIASQFRKDKIWMRRMKPSKREYQILLAIDDSSSMADNRSKELAFESLALVSQALTLLEVGELGILSFGETIKVLHKLGEPFTQHSGARLLQQFSFDQRKTQIGLLVDFASTLLTDCKVQTSAQHAQLLVVISDGRGVFSEGQEKVYNCVRKARLAGIFMVFVIIDNPESKDSILDIRTPIFSGGKLLGISSYMDSFPFPFYLILRDISNLPAVLSDALRQWFELVSSVE